MAVLEEVARRRIPGSLQTRWNFESRTVQIVHQLKDVLIECSTILEKSNSSSTSLGSVGIKKLLLDNEFVF